MELTPPVAKKRADHSSGHMISRGGDLSSRQKGAEGENSSLVGKGMEQLITPP